MYMLQESTAITHTTRENDHYQCDRSERTVDPQKGKTAITQ